MSSKRSAAQRRAIAAAYSRKAAPGSIYGRGSYYKRSVRPAARRVKIRGRGDYASDWQAAGTRYGSKIGSALGNIADVASDVGKIIGFGDYAKVGWNVKQNSLLSMGNDPPEIQNAKDGRVILRHREYLQDIVTGAAGQFRCTPFRIQPGLESTFPWLAQVAQAFEQYKLRGMIFEFKSTSADALNSTNTALGSVIMATEYDCVRPDFQNKQEMENHQYAASARQSSSMIHPIECARDQTPITQLYIRTGAVPPGTDPRLYDFGKFQIATVGQQADNVNIGELWVTYEIELFKPMINEVGSVQQSGVWRNTSGITPANPFGNPSTRMKSSMNNVDVKIEANGFFFPIGTRGTFQMSYYVHGTSGSWIPPFVQSAGGTTLGPTIQPWSGSYIIGPDTTVGTATQFLLTMMFRCEGQSTTGGPPGILFTSGTYFNATETYLYVTAVKDGMSLASLVPDIPLSGDYAFEEYQRLMYAKFLEHKYAKNEIAHEKDDDSKAGRLYMGEPHDDDESDSEEFEDMTKSTAASIFDVIERAKAKRAALERH